MNRIQIGRLISPNSNRLGNFRGVNLSVDGWLPSRSVSLLRPWRVLHKPEDLAAESGVPPAGRTLETPRLARLVERIQLQKKVPIISNGGARTSRIRPENVFGEEPCVFPPFLYVGRCEIWH